MKERPILFSAPMVRAVLEGRKSQTRRVLRPQPHEKLADTVHYDRATGGAMWASIRGDHGVACPFGLPGERLWVREAWRVGAWKEDDGLIAADYRADNHARREWLDACSEDSSEMFNRLWQQSTDDAMAADLETDSDGRYKWAPGASPCRWRPGIHMPRWACRIVLEVAAVRVERLQQISHEDAAAEGVKCDLSARTFCDHYRVLWDSLNEKRGHGWKVNPWVWVVEFKPTTISISPLTQETP
jgi:hypothetical protein